MKLEYCASRRANIRCFIVSLSALCSAHASAAADTQLDIFVRVRPLIEQHWPWIAGVGVGLILVQLATLMAGFCYQRTPLQSSESLPPSAEIGAALKVESEPTTVNIGYLLSQTDHIALSRPDMIGAYIDDLVAVSGQAVLERPAAAALVARRWMSSRENVALSGDEDHLVTVLLAMGETAGRSIAAQMRPQELEQLSRAMMQVADRDRLYIADALRQFLQDVDQAMPLAARVPSFMKGVILPALEATKSGHRVSKLLTAAGYYTDVELLQFVAPQSIADVLEDEHPQIVAVALMALEPAQAAAVLGHLAPALRKDVLLRMAKMDSVAPFALEELSHIIESNRTRLESAPPQAVDGVSSVAAILNAATSEACFGLLDALRGSDPPLGKKIQASMWGGETFTALDPQTRDRFVGSLTVDTLALLIQGMDAQLADRWLTSMPADLAAQVRDKQQANGALSREEIAASRLARQQLTAAAALDETDSKRNDRGVVPVPLAKAGVS